MKFSEIQPGKKYYKLHAEGTPGSSGKRPRLVHVARVLEVNPATKKALVSINGAPSQWVPFSRLTVYSPTPPDPQELLTTEQRKTIR